MNGSIWPVKAQCSAGIKSVEVIAQEKMHLLTCSEQDPGDPAVCRRPFSSSSPALCCFPSVQRQGFFTSAELAGSEE
jgi:hypothetical protein